jgi:hypothetical protein
MATPHTYEQVRDVVIDALTGTTIKMAAPWQYNSLLGAVLSKLQSDQYISDADGKTVADVFWDLFRQGYITLGFDNPNNFWPFFRLSPFGQQSLATANPIRFHDATSYMALVRARVPDLPTLNETYLVEAIKDFYAGCLLSASVMLGVAAEIEFNRLVDTAVANATHGGQFSATASKRNISQRIDAFRKAYNPIKANFNVEDIDNRLLNIQSILRISRNDAGHAMAASVSREEVFINLQMFVSYAGHLYELRRELT